MSGYERMKSYRKAKGLTIAELAKRVGISKPYLSMIENGTRKLSYDMAVMISNNLDRTPDEVFLPDYYTKKQEKKQV
jgi:putative transcriptional regulator